MSDPWTYRLKCVECGGYLTDEEYCWAGVCPHCGRQPKATLLEAYKEIGKWRKAGWRRRVWEPRP